MGLFAYELVSQEIILQKISLCNVKILCSIFTQFGGRWKWPGLLFIFCVPSLYLKA